MKKEIDKMKNLFDKNGLIFWNESQIKLRRMFETILVDSIINNLRQQNSAFQIIQIEAPILTPKEFVNPNYSTSDMFVMDDLVLRPETTAGSFLAARDLMNTHNEVKFKAPLVVWQHGKSFRREQDQPTKFMRLKEFYQLEFQIIYGISTANDYSIKLNRAIQESLIRLIGPCRLEPSDRLPSYSEETNDIICEQSNMEVCSISKRKDLEGYKVLEVAIGTDRLIYNYEIKEYKKDKPNA